MLTAVVVNDERMDRLAQLLEKRNPVTRICSLQDCQSLSCDCLILPMFPKSTDRKIIQALFEEMDSGIPVYAGVRWEGYQKCPAEINYLFEDEEVIQGNALLTAEGVLMKILQHTPRSLKQTKFDVIGYGHCGKAIADLLNRLGCDVRILSRHLDHEVDGIPVIHPVQADRVREVVINTSMLPQIMLAQLPKQFIIFDISSCSFGTRHLKESVSADHWVDCCQLPVQTAVESAAEILMLAIEKKEKL